MFADSRKIHYLLSRDLGLLYLTETFLLISESFVSLFIPIYLYFEMGISLWIVILLHAAEYTLYNFLIYPGYKLSSRIGIKKMISISMVIHALCIMFLMISRNKIPFLYFVFHTLFAFFYYPALSIDEVLFTKKSLRGEEVGILKTVSLFVSALIPFASAILITKFGFRATFIISIIFSIMASMPILFSKEEHNFKKNISIKSVVSFIKRYPKKKEFIAYISQGFVADNLKLLWPIFLFLLLPDYESIGMITTITILVGIFIALKTAKNIDRHGTGTALKVGAYSQLFVWIFKTLLLFMKFANFVYVLIATTFHKFSDIVLDLGVKTEFMNHADNKNTIVEFLCARKFVRQLGRNIPFYILALITYFAEDPKVTIAVSFLVSGILVLSFPSFLKE